MAKGLVFDRDSFEVVIEGVTYKKLDELSIDDVLDVFKDMCEKFKDVTDFSLEDMEKELSYCVDFIFGEGAFTKIFDAVPKRVYNFMHLIAFLADELGSYNEKKMEAITSRYDFVKNHV